MLNEVARLIRDSKTILLSTHRQCDGDGLGAELAMYFALQKMGKKAFVVNLDATPKKYRFLNPDQYIQYFEEKPVLPATPDLCLVFDTNDRRMLEGLYPVMESSCKNIAFIDHHPILKKGPPVTYQSWIDTSAASTGELAYRLIEALGIDLDAQIARCLYTSLVFDTQLFKFIRNSPVTHQIAAKLLQYPIRADEVHRALFGNQTVSKIAFLAKTLGQIEYFHSGQLAVLKVLDSDLFHYNLEADDTRDLIDMVMSIESLEAAALIREDSSNTYKLSLRSKGLIEVLSVAESFNGGGHPFAAGALIEGTYEQIKDSVVKQLESSLNQLLKTGT